MTYTKEYFNKNKACIHVTTREQWDRICEEFDIHFQYAKFTDNGENSIIYPSDNTYSSMKYPRENGHQIVEFSELFTPKSLEYEIY